MFPRSLYGCERHPEWQGHHPASLTSVGPANEPGLCPLAADNSNMLDSSMNAPESWNMPRTLPSSREVFPSVEQLGHRQNLNSEMDPEVASLSMAIAALCDLSHAGESTIHRLFPYNYPGPQVLWWAGCVHVATVCLNQECLVKSRTFSECQNRVFRK